MYNDFQFLFEHQRQNYREDAKNEMRGSKKAGINLRFNGEQN